ncbi:TPA: toll/interleukin-1 receptor domain-containing protein [Klebsiella aerogenes]|nr:toll/interleukin-1 receptor domain-containing protein [Serratia marcescens]HBR6870234.1 toll/interleukin-1 receptor domain-containing protein [Klebsiella aerogenes]
MMYRAYSLRVDDDTFSGYLSDGEAVKIANNYAAQGGLDAFFDGDGNLIATKIIEDWFPKMKADVFISHSHKDEALAIQLAGWLKDKLGVSSFIDSCVWGYSPELLKKLDKNFCLKESGYYDYDRRNITNGHVNMMLATSLTKMIDQCECIIFLNTPNSISCKGCIESDGTKSPWIYAEIEATRLLRKNKPERRRTLVKASTEGGVIVMDEAISVKYDLDLKHLLLLDKSQILKLHNSGKTGTDALDFLYDSI